MIIIVFHFNKLQQDELATNYTNYTNYTSNVTTCIIPQVQ